MWPFRYCLDVYCIFVDVSTNVLVLFKTINNIILHYKDYNKIIIKKYTKTKEFTDENIL